jgi:hypothetical protein
MSLIHALLCIPSSSDLFLFFEIQKIFGARSWGLWPCSQALHQKDILVLSPTVIEVAAANRSLSVVSHGVSGLFNILPSSSHSFHSHTRRSALANFPRWRMPGPRFNWSCGTWPIHLHFPSVSLSDLAHGKLFLRLSISFSVALGALTWGDTQLVRWGPL